MVLFRAVTAARGRALARRPDLISSPSAGAGCAARDRHDLPRADDSLNPVLAWDSRSRGARYPRGLEPQGAASSAPISTGLLHPCAAAADGLSIFSADAPARISPWPQCRPKVRSPTRPTGAGRPVAGRYPELMKDCRRARMATFLSPLHGRGGAECRPRV